MPDKRYDYYSISVTVNKALGPTLEQIAKREGTSVAGLFRQTVFKAYRDDLTDALEALEATDTGIGANGASAASQSQSG